MLLRQKALQHASPTPTRGTFGATAGSVSLRFPQPVLKDAPPMKRAWPWLLLATLASALGAWFFLRSPETPPAGDAGRPLSGAAQAPGAPEAGGSPAGFEGPAAEALRSALPQAEGTTPIALRLLVVARDEGPIGNARLLLTDARGRRISGSTDPRGGVLLEGELELPVKLAARAQGHAAIEHRLSRIPNTLTLVLDPATFLAGCVRDDEDQPVAQALVRVRERRGEASRSRELRTDPEGRFRIDGLRPGDHDVLVVPGSHAAPIRDPGLWIPPEGLTRDYTSLSGATLALRVSDLLDRPLAGAKVTSVDGSLHTADRPGFSIVKEDWRTDEHGRLDLRGLAPGHLRLYISAEDHASVVQDVVFQASESQELTVRLDEGADLRGQVFLPSEEHASGAIVVFTPLGLLAQGARDQIARDAARLFGTRIAAGPDGALRITTTTDSKGEWSLSGLQRLGRVRIHAELPGQAAPSPGRKIDLASIKTGQAKRILLELREGREVSGRVLAPDSEPVAEAIVSIGQSSARTDSEGVYRFRSCAFGESLPVQVQHAAFGELKTHLTIAPRPGPLEFDLHFEAGERFEVHACDVKGFPIAQALVHVHRVSDSDRDAEPFARLRTDESGWITLGGCQDPLLSFEVHAVGFEITTLQAQAGRPLHAVLRREALRPGGDLSLLVTDPTGKAIPGLRVLGVTPDRIRHHGPKVLLRNLRSTSHELRLEAPHHQALSLPPTRVHSKRTTALGRIIMHPASPLTLEWADAVTEKPARWADADWTLTELEYQGNPRKLLRAQVQEHNDLHFRTLKVRWPSLRLGRYRVSFKRPGHPLRSLEFVVAFGRDAGRVIPGSW